MGIYYVSIWAIPTYRVYRLYDATTEYTTTTTTSTITVHCNTTVLG